MKMAKNAIETEYGVVLSNKGNYTETINSMDANGHFSNLRKVVKVLFFYGKLLDDLTLEVENLKKRQTINVSSERKNDQPVVLFDENR